MSSLPRLHLPMRRPEDVIPFLGKPTHWKEGRSAKSLADSWFAANDLPVKVRQVIEQAPDYRGAELVDAFLERCTSLEDGRSTPSQTDLLAVVAASGGLAIIGVEAKVTETFGQLVGERIDEKGGKPARLAQLCATLGVDVSAVMDLRYQLLHRTVAAMIEAKRYRADRAVMLVHSFCTADSGLADFERFAQALGWNGARRNGISDERICSGVRTRLAWVAEHA